MDEHVYPIGRLTLRPDRELSDGSARIALGERALGLLSELARRKGELVLKDELFAAVWNGAIVEENALQAQVSAVRKALGSEAARLVTVHGRGYCLRLDPADEPAAAQPGSIAVLAFANLTGDPGNDYLGDGLAEELIAALSRGTGLKVPSRTSSFAYRGRVIDIRTIARELGVATVLEGSVRGAGERLRVTAQLIDAASDFHIWAQSFDRTMTDLLTLQDDLAGAIAAALRRELGPRLRETHSAEALRLVMEARAASRSLSREGMHEAVRLARAALALDPGFAKAWESLAGSTLVMASVGFAPPQSFEEARGYAERAIELAPQLSGALGIIAGVEAAAGRLLAAAELLDRAMSFNPEDGVAGEHAALSVLTPAGLIGRGAEIARTSIARAPARPQPYLVGAICAAVGGDLARAARLLDDALMRGLSPNRPPVEILKSEIALAAQDFSGASRPMARLVAREFAVPGAIETVEAIFAAMAGTGGKAAASAAAAALFAAADRSGSLWVHTTNPGLVLSMQARLGALDAAFAVAQRVIERWRETGRLATGSLNTFWLSDMAPFRRDPRFQELIQALGLFPFWERHGPPDGHAISRGKLVIKAN